MTETTTEATVETTVPRLKQKYRDDEVVGELTTEFGYDNVMGGAHGRRSW